MDLILLGAADLVPGQYRLAGSAGFYSQLRLIATDGHRNDFAEHAGISAVIADRLCLVIIGLAYSTGSILPPAGFCHDLVNQLERAALAGRTVDLIDEAFDVFTELKRTTLIAHFRCRQFQRRLIVASVAVTATGTVEIRIALRSKGGLGDGFGVAVVKGWHIVALVAVTTGTGVSGITLLGTGRRYYDKTIGMCMHDGRTIGFAIQRQDTAAASSPSTLGIIIICICIATHSIAIGNTAGAAGKEQSAISTHAVTFTVGHIHQVVLSSNLNNVPHVRSAHNAGCQHTRHIPGEICLLTQIHKGLGIAFTDHIGGTVAVKHMYQLPRVVIFREITIVSSLIIISDQFADLVFITHQFFVV